MSDRDEHRVALVEAIQRSDVDAVRRFARTARECSVDDAAFCIGTALHEQQLEMLRQLLQCGVDPDSPCGFGETHLFGAAALGWTAAAKILIEAGADVNHRSDNGVTPLRACLYSSDSSPSMFRLLLEAGADPHQIDEDGETPAMQAKGMFRQVLVDLDKLDKL